MLDRDRYEKLRVPEIEGRYLPPEGLEAFARAYLSVVDDYRVWGYSVENRPVYSVCLGNGPIKILMWSQMHGNESTTTKALLDLIRTIKAKALPSLEAFTFLLLPILNPDGARAYTRHNANQVDLNRDARRLSQPESRVLREAYDSFAPDFCFNLHDQRTIFSAGEAPKAATLSFLAPAADETRDFPANRKMAAQIIAAISKPIRKHIGVGRYDDTYNPDCVGDAFQEAGTPTMLFEAGHYPGDYQREQTRFFVYQAMLNALEAIRLESFTKVPLHRYMEIPANQPLFLDVLIRNAHLLNPKYPSGWETGIQYSEVLEGGRIHFRPQIKEEGALQGFYGHKSLDAARPGDLRQLKSSPELLQLFLSDPT